MIEWAVILLLFLAVLVLFYKYSRIQGQVERKAREIFESWRRGEREDLENWKEQELKRLSDEKARILFDAWRQDEEGNIRTDAIKRSQSVTRGKVTECLIPYFPDFPYNPKDARFLGTPVDLIVFDGLSDADEVQNVVFVEIKTGKAANLSKRERAVRECIKAGRVQYSTIHQSFDEETNRLRDIGMN
ncbi:Holliday junction resolvase [Methanoculleus sp. YWC-01]|jgi:predicted Holliday junction resolvase-like endonuclease|uniref:Holliday junction resolvase n=1 Tax=Methanoculleus nereidis TaxID=2735141 RepID=A0ABU3YYX5_9EURY|nr:Holliday junction resolvase-like protein [Methanoculleus sp. YWC-01]MCK9297596.1 Holliday junction resolvase [Methanoculleus sp.]MDV4341749.1 Holliday junction resolvase [Methanoculleus sp. YWC-01]PKL56213.1 MAG: Holliday junction resolvase [Methanomicrobiales archaeon HGW-Methanomicrobiales-6]